MTNGIACEILDQHRRREKTIKFTTLFLCTNKMVFLFAFKFTFLSVIQWNISWRQSLSWLKEQSVSRVAKER